MEWWTVWNLRAAKHEDFVYRLEDLDVKLFREMLAMLGVRDTAYRAARALTSVSTSVNSARDRNEMLDLSITWETLPEGPHKERLGDVASELGYRPDFPPGSEY